MLACLLAVIAVSLSVGEDKTSDNKCGLGGCEGGVEGVESVEGVEEGCAPGECVEGVEKRKAGEKEKPGPNNGNKGKKPGRG